MTTLAGTGVAGYTDGVAAAAQFNLPQGVAVDSSGNVYVGDTENHKIRKITSGGTVSTLAGSTLGYTNATSTAAQFYSPKGVAVDGSGNVYVADWGNCAIRKITLAGVVSTFAGQSLSTFSCGYIDATGTAAAFWYPQGITLDGSGNVYVTDNSLVVRMITPAGVVSTLAGSWTSSHLDGPAIAAKFKAIQGIAVDGSGNVFVADKGGHRIRKISATPYSYKVGGHVVGLVSNNNLVLQNNLGDDLTVSAEGLFNFATPLTDISGAASYNVTISAQPAGQTCTIANNTGGFTTGDVSTVSINCATVTTLAGSGVEGFANGAGTDARFSFPFSWNEYTGIATDASGNVYVADTLNYVVRKITPAGVVSTYAGSTYGYLDSATATTAKFGWLQSVAVDGAGNVYVGDSGRIRKISPTGAVTTLAGSGGQGYLDGPGATAMFGNIQGMAVDTSGNVYVADSTGHAIRKVTSAGVVSTLAGDGISFGYLNGSGNVALFNKPTSVALDSSGNVYVTDYNNYAIRKVTPDGVVSTFAGYPENRFGTIGYFNSTGTGAKFHHLSGVAVDAANNVYVADTWNNVIRVIDPVGTVSTLAGPTAPTTTAGFTNGNGASALFNYPDGIAVDAAGNVYVADSKNNVIRKIVQ